MHARVRRPFACLLVVLVLGSASFPGPAYTDRLDRWQSSGAPPVDLPVTRTHHYRMAGRIRPLLFWVGRDNVGLARIVWRGHDERRGYDFLVGTDPAIAPRAINRWGFITEVSQARGGSVFALMSRADEASYDEARANTDKGGSGAEYRGLEAQLEDGLATWRVARVATAREATIHDVEQLAAQVRRATANAPAQTTRTARQTRPGFLVAVAELVARGVERARLAAGRLDVSTGAVPYIFGRGLYEIRLRELSPVRVPPPWQGRAGRAAHGEFEILTVATGARTRFEMTFGLTGELAGVPLEISWQPRWWLKVELYLLEP